MLAVLYPASRAAARACWVHYDESDECAHSDQYSGPCVPYIMGQARPAAELNNLNRSRIMAPAGSGDDGHF